MVHVHVDNIIQEQGKNWMMYHHGEKMMALSG